MKKTVLIFLSLVFTGTYTFSQTQGDHQGESKRPKNIIFFIGDGMGLSEVYAAYTASNQQLHITQSDHIALVTTFSDDNYITDSGAAGTALACGVKTSNGSIGMTSDGTPLTSILKLADRKGLATGMVTTCDITHATPAAFMASVKSRKQRYDIAHQFLETDIDIFIGGGLDNFNQRPDSLNLVDSLKLRGYEVITTLDGIKDSKSTKIAGLLYPAHPPKMSEGRGEMLPVSVKKAIEVLSENKNGFFMMVEGSQIDWGGHDNDIDYIIAEALDFDKAIAAALEFARTNGETLIVITADHETGGMSNLEGNFAEGTAGGKFTTTDHSAIPVPLFATGPGSIEFRGFIDNTDVFKIMKKLLEL